MGSDMTNAARPRLRLMYMAKWCPEPESFGPVLVSTTCRISEEAVRHSVENEYHHSAIKAKGYEIVPVIVEELER